MGGRKSKTPDERLEGIELLLASLVLERQPSVEEVAKTIGMQKAKLIRAVGKKKPNPKV